MAMKKNERYRCVNPKCCCEIDVVKESLDAASVRNPRCACGQDMKRMYGRNSLSAALADKPITRVLTSPFFYAPLSTGLSDS